MSEIITIGMPVFNDVDYIEESILSILNQSFQDFILILSDDGASDGSSEICKKFAEQDSRIKYIRQPKNLGISKNMEFLIEQANTPYFMWAGDDDLWDINFIDKHINELDKNPKAIVSFCSYQLMNDNNLSYKTVNIDYGSQFKLVQLLKLIHYEDDGFGYGVFRTKAIKGVKFPIWWWPNRKTPYNNIFPSLCFYLNRGRYLHIHENLFFKRVKTGSKVNHIISGSGNGYKELISYYLRRLYLTVYSAIQILKSPFFFNAFLVFPFMFVKWFVYSSFKITIQSLKNKSR